MLHPLINYDQKYNNIQVLHSGVSTFLSTNKKVLSMVPEVVATYLTGEQPSTLVVLYPNGGEALLGISEVHQRLDRPKPKVIVADTSYAVVSTYRAVRDNYSSVLAEVRRLRRSFNTLTGIQRLQCYNTLKDEFTALVQGTGEDIVRLAACFIFLDILSMGDLSHICLRWLAMDVPPIDCEQLQAASYLLEDVNFLWAQPKRLVELVGFSLRCQSTMLLCVGSREQCRAAFQLANKYQWQRSLIVDASRRKPKFSLIDASMGSKSWTI